MVLCRPCGCALLLTADAGRVYGDMSHWAGVKAIRVDMILQGGQDLCDQQRAAQLWPGVMESRSLKTTARCRAENDTKCAASSSAAHLRNRPFSAEILWAI